MPTWTFIKRGGAPAGSIKIEVSDGEFILDDTGNPSIATSSPTVAAELLGIPYLQLQGGAPTPAPVLHSVDSVFLDNGVLSKAGYRPEDSGGGAAQQRSVRIKRAHSGGDVAINALSDLYYYVVLTCSADMAAGSVVSLKSLLEYHNY